jgi:hypothetical protein
MNLTINELWENATIAEEYDGGDAYHLIGKHFLAWNRASKLMYHILTEINISDIETTSEDMSVKVPVYQKLTTQAPPVDVTIEESGKYRLYNGHRRLASAKARGETKIFVEIVIPFVEKE